MDSARRKTKEEIYAIKRLFYLLHICVLYLRIECAVVNEDRDLEERQTDPIQQYNVTNDRYKYFSITEVNENLLEIFISIIFARYFKRFLKRTCNYAWKLYRD